MEIIEELGQVQKSESAVEAAINKMREIKVSLSTDHEDFIECFIDKSGMYAIMSILTRDRDVKVIG